MLSRSTLKALYCRLQLWTGLDRRQLKRLQAEQRVAIVNLHRVSPEPSPFWPALRPDLFDDLVRYLRQHCHLTTFGQLQDVPVDRPAVVLSFDDGYYDFMQYAAPVLEKYGVPANQNVIGHCARTGSAPWNIELYDFLQAAPGSLLRRLALPGLTARLDGGDAAAKARFGLAISRYLKNRPKAERSQHWDTLTTLMQEAPDYPRTRMMTPDEIRQIASVHEIGSHSDSHESMGYESLDFFADDFRLCQTFFAETLALPLTIYAFPNGSYRPEQIQHLQESGIQHVLLVDERLATRQTAVYPRLTAYGDDHAELRLRALGVFSNKAP